ncbi:MAG: S1C family serine protease, partial [Planctomycetota bacterium]
MRRTLVICVLGGGAVWSGCADGAGGPGGAAGVVTTNGLSRLDFRQVIKEAQGRVFPSVVFVKCLREGHESGKKITSEMIGSGVLISPDGELLTNWHVVDKAAEIRCLLYDGRALDAEVLGKDKDTDLALVKLKLPADGPPTPHAPLGDSTRLKEGDFVMAMGAPWGLNRSVSIGIVSCLRRYLPDHSEYGLWLQTDAAISPGNSGGPLVNTDGEVVGINTRSVLFGGDMGFAVPAEIVRIIVPQLRTHGQVDWSWTGLRLQPLKDFKRNIYFEGDQGVVVASTDPESPARRAGVRPRDRILAIGEEPLTAVWEEDLPGVRRQIGLLQQDRPVAVRLIRDGREMTPTFT